MAEVVEQRPPVTHLLTQLCAIAGGVVTVLGVLDSLLYRVYKLCSRKS